MIHALKNYYLRKKNRAGCCDISSNIKKYNMWALINKNNGNPYEVDIHRDCLVDLKKKINNSVLKIVKCEVIINSK